MPADAIAGIHRELNRQTEDYDLTVRAVEEAADEAFEKRWTTMLCGRTTVTKL
jgi:hypothetical protein